MKKVILFLCLLFTITCVYSQEHLKFKDIPIDGKISSFVKKLKKQGYKQYAKDDHSYHLLGKFAGEDASVFPICTEKTKTVWKVMVMIHVENGWEEIAEKYYELKQLYVRKYGSTFKSFEHFKKGSEEDKLKAIMNEEGAYATFFNLLNGNISIQIKVENSVNIIMITYEDLTNGNLFESENLANKLEDI